jgi:hypothetical protein
LRNHRLPPAFGATLPASSCETSSTATNSTKAVSQSLDETGRIFNVNRDRICQIELEALKKGCRTHHRQRRSVPSCHRRWLNAPELSFHVPIIVAFRSAKVCVFSLSERRLSTTLVPSTHR